jgi:putative endonuclease
MFFYVYLLISTNTKKKISYVGYTNNPKLRLEKHNKGIGAKFTRGRKWKMLYKKKFTNKNDALKFEIYLKKNIKMRSQIKEKYLNEHRFTRQYR